MPIPAQFELGLELTNIVHPLSRALWSVGSLALSDAIEKAGSSVITEAKLASLIGRFSIGTQFHRSNQLMSSWFVHGLELFSSKAACTNRQIRQRGSRKWLTNILTLTQTMLLLGTSVKKWLLQIDS